MPRLPPWALAVLLVAAAIGYFLIQRDAAPTPIGDARHERIPPAPSPPIPPPPRSPPRQAPAESPPAPRLDLEGIGDAEERDTIRKVVRAIDAGGPFAYRKDGTVFENRERRLPAQARGYWREYTVPTPGEDDRGARRLIGGKAGELFYTRDHYRTFRRVRGPD